MKSNLTYGVLGRQVWVGAFVDAVLDWARDEDAIVEWERKLATRRFHMTLLWHGTTIETSSSDSLDDAASVLLECLAKELEPQLLEGC